MMEPWFNPKELIGRLLFNEHKKTFLKILAVVGEEPGVWDGYPVKVVNLATGEETNDYAVGGLTGELFGGIRLVPADFPPEKVDEYLRAVKFLEEAEKAINFVKYQSEDWEKL